MAHTAFNSNMPFFLRRFSNCLDFYSSLFRSFELGAPRDSLPRQLFESSVIARPLTNAVACDGSHFVLRNEPLGRTRGRMGRAGFEPAAYPPSCAGAMADLLSHYPHGFTVEAVRNADVADGLANMGERGGADFWGAAFGNDYKDRDGHRGRESVGEGGGVV